MSLSLGTGVSMLAVFLQGLLSFLSPCVLPLLPLYIGYLAGGTQTVDGNGVIHYPRKKIMLNTLFFVIGISFTFFLLGFGFTMLGKFFTGNQLWFARVGGIIMIIFGLYQLGLFGSANVLTKEKRLPFRLNSFAMGPIPAFILGFTFSFAWTPCVGPVLSSVLLMAGSADTSALASALILVYTLGFALPFLAVGLFTGALLEFFKKHGNIVRYTVKIGAILLIIMGIMTMTGLMNGITDSLGDAAETEQQQETEEKQQESAEAFPAPDFSLTDQNGDLHKLSDYKGKTVLLNFWATWCPPCKREMPDIQSLYEQYGSNQGDLIVIGVAGPNQGREGSSEEITKFLTEKSYTFPVVMDETGEIFQQYSIAAFPTTFLIDAAGNIYGYVEGALTAEMLEDAVKQTMNSQKND
ncbi:MAG: cytochrome c biogenesis protein CcdA [Bacillota bacterium]|jgi:cytochrome c-type biogenesis protein